VACGSRRSCAGEAMTEISAARKGLQ
jgi:hypothetical protein